MDKSALLHRFEEARGGLEKLLVKIDPHQEIYPGWTIREFLAHITGWDDATLASLRAHLAGERPTTPAECGIDEYNQRTLSSREDLDLAHILKEWRATRQALIALLKKMPEDKFSESFIVPWGQKGSATEMIEVFIDHEEDHTRDLEEWLKDPRQPLRKAGN